MKSLFTKFDRLVFFDTETTGLIFHQDQIIEFAAAVVELKEGTPTVTQEYDALIALAPGTQVPPEIQKLTGITQQDLEARGIPKEQLCQDLARLFAGEQTLLLAYNAQFDFSFLFYTLLKHGDPSILKGKSKLDLLTVYRDRYPYPHRLASAISAYGLEDRVQNSHRAIDDVLATVAVAEAMEAQRDDLPEYLDLFGYNPKYGVDGKPIGSVTYRPQRYTPGIPIYRAK